MIVRRLAAVTVSGLAVAGCDGSLFTDNPTLDLPANGSVEVPGQARSAGFTGTITSPVVDLELPGGPAGSSVVVVTENNEIVALSVVDGGGRISFDSRDGDFVTLDGELIGFVSQFGGSEAIFANPQSGEYEHQTFGLWYTGGQLGAGTASVGSFGFVTPDDELPAGGTRRAVYTGVSLGWVEENGSLGTAIGNVRAETDFNTMEFQIDDTQVVVIATGSVVPDPRLDLAGEVPVSGASFSGQINGTGSVQLSGSVNGSFYGPSANEVGGTFAVSNSSINYFGSFGASD